MKSKSISGGSVQEIQSAIEACSADGFNPTLAFVFLSAQQDHLAVSNYLNQKEIAIFGATTAGEFVDGAILNGKIAILLLDIDPSNFKINFRDHNNIDTRIITEEMGKEALSSFNNPLFLTVTSGMYLDGDMVIRGIEDAVGKNVSIWGGKASDEGIGVATTVFTNIISSENGICLLVLDGNKIEMTGQAVSGWKGVGTPKRITKRDGLWIQELDDHPALDLMIKYMGYRFKKKGKERHTYDPDITSPFLLLREDDHQVLRAQTFINWDEKSVMLSGYFNDNDLIQLTLPPDFEVVDDVINSSKELLETKMPAPDALLIFSCSGRLIELGPMIETEINGIQEVANAPMAGFFCYGEYGRAKGGDNEYHNYTCSWVALKEKTI